MNINTLFFIKLNFLKNQLEEKNNPFSKSNPKFPTYTHQILLFKRRVKSINIKPFLIKSLKAFSFSKRFLKTKLFQKTKKSVFFNFLKVFLLNFLENFFKNKILLNFKKGTNRLFLKQISFRKFDSKYFKKNVGVTKQIIGIIYYSILLKDSSIFVNFLRRVLENVNLKLHKRIFLGLKKLIKDLFKPIFNYMGLYGLFFNIKGKIGVSGSAKKRRYFFYFGKHSLTNRTLKMDSKNTAVWTPTGALGFTFLVFF